MVGKLPQYIDFANEMRKDIVSGRYGFEGGLPGIEELGRRSKLAHNTIYRSLTLLVGEKLIVQRDKAYYVNRIPYPMNNYIPPVATRMKDLNRRGYIKNIGSVQRIPLPPYLLGRVNGEKMDVVFQMCVIGELIDDDKEVPTQIGRYYYLNVPEDQFSRMQSDPSVDPVSENGPAHLTRLDEITTRIPTQEEAALLNIIGGTSCLGCLSVVRDGDGSVLLIQEDIFSHRLTFLYNYTFENRP